MWPFKQRPAEHETNPGRGGLLLSQLEITKRYGYRGSQMAGQQDLLRESLERHEPRLSPMTEPHGTERAASAGEETVWP